MTTSPTISFAFLGSSNFSVFVLDEMERAGYIPSFVVTTKDKPQGRKMILTPNVVKTWAEKRKIPVLDPAKLDHHFIEHLRITSTNANVQVFIIASYGKIIPEDIIEIPIHKTLNIHPSLLPKYRGASPLQTAMLDDDKDTGITIMSIDKEMDHGNIVAQEAVHIDKWPTYEVFEKMMAEKGGQLLVKILPQWVDGKITVQEQNHNAATFTKKMTKEDGLINLNDDAYTNFRKIQALHEWPQAYFHMIHGGKQIRVKITQASFVDGTLHIEKVIPEGSKEISMSDFERGYIK